MSAPEPPRDSSTSPGLPLLVLVTVRDEVETGVRNGRWGPPALAGRRTETDTSSAIDTPKLALVTAELAVQQPR